MPNAAPSTSPHARAGGRRHPIVLALAVLLGLLLLAPAPMASAAPGAKAVVKVRVKTTRSTYSVGERPVLRIKVRAKRAGRKVPAKGKVVVKALGQKQKVIVRRGKAKVRLPELTQAGRVTVRVTFKGKRLPRRTVTTHVKVQQAAWEVPDAALRQQIRSALGLPDGHTLTLDDAADLDNAKGVALWFGDVRTAAGLELATNLTVLDDYTAGRAQDSRGLDNIVRVNGDFWISNAVQDAHYPSLAYVGGDISAFNIDTERLRSISMPVLADAKSVRIENRPQLASIGLPRLTTVRESVTINDAPALTALELPALATVGDNVRIEDLDVATAVRLPSLTDTVNLTVIDGPRVRTLDLAGLSRVHGRLQVSNLPLLGGLSAPALQQVATDLTIYGLRSITELRMPALQWSRGRVSFGIGEDFPVLPGDGSAVSFPAFDVTQTVDFDFAVRGLAYSRGSTKVERWQEFLAHLGVVG